MRFFNKIGNVAFSRALHLSLAAADQGHAVRDQGDLAQRLRAASRRGAATSATSIRSATSTSSSGRRASTSRSRRSRCATATAPTARPTSRAGSTAFSCCGCRRWQRARSSSSERGAALRRTAGAHAGAVRRASAGLGRQPGAADALPRVVRPDRGGAAPAGARAAGRARLGAGVRAAVHPRSRALGHRACPLARSRGERGGVAVRRRSAGRAGALRRPPSPAERRGGSSRRRRGSCARADES